MSPSKEQVFQQRLLATFRIEVEEHVNAISASLLSIEEGADTANYLAVFESIYRGLHSLKGAARAVGIHSIEIMCQALEDLFNRLKNEQGRLDRNAFDVLHKAIDFLRKASADFVNSDEDAPAGTNLLLQQIKEISSTSPLPNKEPQVSDSLTRPEKAMKEQSSLPPVSIPYDTVRVNTEKLDAILLQSEEMILMKQMLGHHVGTLSALKTELDEIVGHLKRQINPVIPTPIREMRNEMQLVEEEQTSIDLKAHLDSVSNARDFLVRTMSGFDQDAKENIQVINRLIKGVRSMVLMPFNSTLELFNRMVRDLANEQGKEVSLHVTGSELEVDKRIIELMKDPLIHILRNCIDHGIELPDLREAQGKGRKGKIHISILTLSGNMLEVRISDDGCGINTREIGRLAVSKGLIPEENLKSMSPADQMELIFLSGLSTSAMLTEISGRGLGMTIVKQNVESLGGSVTLESDPGKGSSFLIRLPLSFGTFSGIRIVVGEQEFVIPARYVEKVVRLKSKAIKTFGGRQVIPFEDDSISLEHLDEILQLDSVQNNPDGGFFKVLILNKAPHRLGLVVHDVLGEEEILVKTFPEPMKNVRHFEGITLLGTGKGVLVVNVYDLFRSVELRQGVSQSASKQKDSEITKGSILIAEDSMTARMLLKDILESAGYKVMAAFDGAKAYVMLKEGKHDLLVSDIEMPHMDGFELCERIRKDDALKELPIILVTALKSREDQERGMEAGANAYIEKGRFDPEKLLQVIEQLIV